MGGCGLDWEVGLCPDCLSACHSSRQTCLLQFNREEHFPQFCVICNDFDTVAITTSIITTTIVCNNAVVTLTCLHPSMLSPSYMLGNHGGSPHKANTTNVRGSNNNNIIYSSPSLRTLSILLEAAVTAYAKALATTITNDSSINNSITSYTRERQQCGTPSTFYPSPFNGSASDPRRAITITLPSTPPHHHHQQQQQQHRGTCPSPFNGSGSDPRTAITITLLPLPRLTTTTTNNSNNNRGSLWRRTSDT